MSAFSIVSVPVLAQHNLPNAHALAQAQTKQRSETSLSSPLSCMAYALAITMDATQPTAPSQSSELTLTSLPTEDPSTVLRSTQRQLRSSWPHKKACLVCRSLVATLFPSSWRLSQSWSSDVCDTERLRLLPIASLVGWTWDAASTVPSGGQLHKPGGHEPPCSWLDPGCSWPHPQDLAKTTGSMQAADGGLRDTTSSEAILDFVPHLFPPGLVSSPVECSICHHQFSVFLTLLCT